MGIAHHRAQRGDGRAGQRSVCTQRHCIVVGLCTAGAQQTAVDRRAAACVCGDAGQRCACAHCAAKGGGTRRVDGQCVCTVYRTAQGDGSRAGAGQRRICTQGHCIVIGLCAGGVHRSPVDRRAAACIGGQASQRYGATHCATKSGRCAVDDGQGFRTIDGASEGVAHTAERGVCTQRHRAGVGLRAAARHRAGIDRRAAAHRQRAQTRHRVRSRVAEHRIASEGQRMGIAHHGAQRGDDRSGQRRVRAQRHRTSIGLRAAARHCAGIDRRAATHRQRAQACDGVCRRIAKHRIAGKDQRMGIAHHRAQRANRCAGKRGVRTQCHRVAVGLRAGGFH